jgi:phosphatidylserine synthase
MQIMKGIIFTNTVVANILYIVVISCDFPTWVKYIVMIYLAVSCAMLSSYLKKEKRPNEFMLRWHIVFFLCAFGIVSGTYILLNIIGTGLIASVYICGGIAAVAGLLYGYMLLRKKQERLFIIFQ